MKKQSVMIENKARNDGTNIFNRISEPSDANAGTNNLTSIKLAYKHSACKVNTLWSATTRVSP